MRRHRPWMRLAPLVVLIACGCSSPYDKINPEFKQNQQPKQRYQLTLTIANAPGPFASVQGFMQFDVDTPECLPPPNANGGHLWPTPTEDIPIAWTRVSDTEYTGVVYIDGMVDEDYYGRGLCRWKMMQAYAVLKATGADGETRFNPSIYPEQVLARQAVVTYFWKPFYPRNADIENYPESGQTDRSKMATTLKDSDLFTATLTPKAMTP
jgi:hypothetical protein